jgi:hypothetical protein
MPDDGPAEPLAFHWVPTGVSGLARRRDWDTVELVDLPELADREVEELRFSVLADGTVVGDSSPVEMELLARLAERLTAALPAPYEAVAVRHTQLEWSLAARSLRIEVIELPGLTAEEIVVAVGPEGATELLVDGVDSPHPDAALAAAAEELERIGRARHGTFVLRARRAVGERFALSVDPL